MKLVTAPTKTRQIEDYLSEQIQSGKLVSGMRLRSMRVLASDFGVGVQVVRSALDNLEKRKLISKQGRSGTFVAKKSAVIAEQKRILVLVGDKYPFESYIRYILPAFLERCEELSMVAESVDPGFLNYSNPSTFLKRNRFSAVLIFGNDIRGNEPELSFLKELGLPVLMPHVLPKDLSLNYFPGMHTDEAAAWRVGLKHLAGLGHRRVVEVFLDRQCIRGKSLKEHAALLREYQCDVEPELFIRIDNFQDNAINLITSKISQLMHSDNPPTAFYCYSDFIAIHVYQAIFTLGLKIPDDVSVLGFCGYPGGALMEPPLSTVDFEYANIGRMAADFLNDPEHMPSVTVTPFHLEIRGSTAKFRKTKNIQKTLNKQSDSLISVQQPK